MNKQDQEEAAARARGSEAIARVRQNQKEATAKAAKQAVNEGRAPYEVLGRDGKSVVLYSRERKGVVCLPADRNISSASLFLLVGEDTTLKAWREEWAEKDDRQLSSAVVKDIASKLGSRIYDPAKVRGAGIWNDPEGIIYSTGRDCYLLREGESVPRPVYPMRPDGTLYASESAKAGMPAPADNALTNAEGRAVYDMLAARSWGEAYAADMLAGWVMVAPLSGLLPIRPHLWINGESNNGKSALMKDLRAVHGGAHEYAKGAESTPTSLRNKADRIALPFYFDEVDTDGRHWKNERALDYASLLRIASDGDEGASRAGREEGTVKVARLRSCFCLTSIRNSLTHAQDYNRFCLLSLEKATAAEIDALEARRAAGYALLERTDAPARLITRCMQQAGFILRNAKEITARLRAAGITERRSLMAGVLLAGRWALTDGGEARAEYLSRCEAIAEAAEQHAQEDCRPEHEELLDVILSHLCLTVPVRMNVRQAAQAVFHGVEVDLKGKAESALISCGIVPRQVDMRRKDSRAGKWHLIIAHNGKAFAPVVEPSKWRDGHGIPTAIKGAPHAEVKKVYLNGKNTTRLLIYEEAINEEEPEHED